MFDPIARLNAALEGRYRIESELGEGGMARVYLADDVRHERKVALKVLRPELAAALGSHHFLREIRVTANLHRAHILPLYDSGDAAGALFYVTPLVRGESLRERLTRERMLPVDETVRIVRQVAAALDFAHRERIVHRDIKPANILLQVGEALLADFGIARGPAAPDAQRLTDTGLSIGTPAYMSPEQAKRRKKGRTRADAYREAAKKARLRAEGKLIDVDDLPDEGKREFILPTFCQRHLCEGGNPRQRPRPTGTREPASGNDRPREATGGKRALPT